MTKDAPRIGKKGGAKRLAEEIAKIRKTPVPKDAVTSILEENKRREQEPLKKSARPRRDIEI